MSDWAQSNPNVSVSGFIDETPCRGPGNCLQAQQEGIEARIAGIISRFDELKLGIADWENFIKCCAVSSAEIDHQFNSFLKAICDLAK